MFDTELEAALGDSRALTDLAATVERDSRMAGCRKLVVAAVWADAHSAVDHPEGGVLVERLVPLGPVGCPAVAEFAAQGLVGPYDASASSVRSWMADALTIRHRLPKLWERVVAGDVHHWKARQIATLTAHLGVAAAAEVDQQTTPWVEQLPWQTFLKALDATMLQVDESTYRERERVAAAKREVRATPSEAGLRTLIARGEAGDVAMMLALCQRVAECLADDGDEDPQAVRMSKAIGVIANPARLCDLLARHADDVDPHQEPWEKVAAHHDDPTDPWADDLPPAGWETDRHGNYHQPGFDDEGEWWDTPGADDDDHASSDPDGESSPDPDDLAWYESNERPADTADTADIDLSTDRGPADGAGAQQRWPAVFRPPGWRPLTPAQLAACAPSVVMHVHLTDETLRTGHGVVRTDDGPITLEQLQRFLVQHEANLTIRPVTDPAVTAAADAYEIPLRLRRAMEIRHPRSVFPHSPTATRLDLDHTTPYAKTGPPGQTGMHNLGPLARCEHRAKTVGRWRARQPEPGTYLWRSPDGWIMITTNQGTLTLGHSDWAGRLWDAADQN
jgi:hypothetical protein